MEFTPTTTNAAQFLQSLSSMSKISKNSTCLSPKKNLFHNTLPTQSIVNIGENGFPFDFLISRGSSGSSSPQTIGRGHYMKTLEQTFSSGDRRAKLDREIHEALQEVNGMGYSNDLIEERYGFKEETCREAAPKADGKIFPEIHASSDQFEDIVDENINASEPAGDVENPNKELPSVQTEYKNPENKKRQRRIRNLVVLNFASKVRTTQQVEANSMLKPPQDFLPAAFTSPKMNGCLQKGEKEAGSLFCEEDFPPLA